MAFGTRLKLEGRSPRSPEWGSFATVLIEAQSSRETLDSATARARRHLERQAALWQQNYDPELEFQIVDESRVAANVGARPNSEVSAQPAVAVRELPANSLTRSPRRNHGRPAPRLKSHQPASRRGGTLQVNTNAAGRRRA
jgi:hypothetical protein